MNEQLCVNLTDMPEGQYLYQVTANWDGVKVTLDQAILRSCLQPKIEGYPASALGWAATGGAALAFCLVLATNVAWRSLGKGF